MSDEIIPPAAPEEAPPRQRRDSSVPLLLFVLLLVLLSSVLILSRIKAGRSNAANRNDALTSLVMGDMQVKLSYFYRTVGLKGDSPSLILAKTTYENAIRQSPIPPALRRLATLQSLDSPAAASATIEKMLSKATLKDLDGRDKARIRSEAAMWRVIYSTQPLSRKQAEKYTVEIKKLNLGPPRHIALQRVYRQSGQTELAAQQELKAKRMFTADLGIVGTIFALATIGGIAGSIALLVLLLSPSTMNRILRLDELHTEEEELSPVLWLSFSAYIFIFLLGSFVVLGILSLLPKDLLNGGRSGLAIVAQVIGYLIPNIIALIAVRSMLRGSGATLRTVGLSAVTPAANVRWGVAGYAVCLPLVAFGQMIAYQIGKLFPNVPTPPNPALPMILSSTSPLALIALFVLVAVAAPFFEEIFFRGVLFRAARSRFGVWPGILISAAVFAMIHPQLPAGFVPIFMLGLVFAVLVQARNSLLPAIIAHAINNGGLFLMVFFATRS